MLKEYYYQIKGKRNDNDNDIDSFSNWVFPPIYSGKVEASCLDSAKKLIYIEYEKKFPSRVLKKDIQNNDYLLKVELLSDYHKDLFENKECLNCGSVFRIIDKYNDINNKDKGKLYCSNDCREVQNGIYVNTYLQNKNISNKNNGLPIIYKITNKLTGKIYIGKTTQIFTLRWYQHFFQSSDNKFHTEIKNTDLINWQFEIQEVVENIDDIIERERFWIKYYDCIENGYNSKY